MEKKQHRSASPRYVLLAHELYLIQVYDDRGKSSQHLDVHDRRSFFRIDIPYASFHSFEVSRLEEDDIAFLERYLEF